MTRLITLDSVTSVDAASDFFGEEHVPRRAITMGLATILQVAGTWDTQCTVSGRACI